MAQPNRKHSAKTIDDDYIHGWKGLAAYYGITVRGLQKWQARKEIPFIRRQPKKWRGGPRVLIHKLVADAYRGSPR